MAIADRLGITCVTVTTWRRRFAEKRLNGRPFRNDFFDLVALTKAAPPGMRAQRHGTIVNISFSAGRMALPGSGCYSATKFAIDSLSEALRKEVAPLGLRVIVVEPSGFRTDFAGRSLQQSRTAIRRLFDNSGASPQGK